MVPDTSDGDEDSDRPFARTDGSGSGFDEAALYHVVRTAMKDAMLDVIGTLLLLGIGFVLVAVGGQVIVQADAVTSGAVGGLLVLAGLYIAAATLELVPPIREWL